MFYNFMLCSFVAFGLKRKDFMVTVIVSVAVIVCMVAGIFFLPVIKIKKISLDSYWVVALIGALLLIVLGQVGFDDVIECFTSDSSVNPLKILVLFISMTFLSVFLDELGFFAWLADIVLKSAGKSQIVLFTVLYAVVSVLTVFTSNDIIILTFTPFICCFAKNADIDPLPYLIAEFVAANTMSMTLVIGNPTNIYISTAYGINFMEYFKVMFLPTLAAAITAYAVLLLLFHKRLGKKTSISFSQSKIKDKPLLVIGVVHLSVCTVLLAVGSYINAPMWIISVISACSLIVCSVIACVIRKKKTDIVFGSFKRLPWQLIPFVLAMFVIVLALNLNGVTSKVCQLLGDEFCVFKYGITSFFAANLINNIPMSVFFCSVMAPLSGTALTQAVFATVAGSNLGAFLTPVGALAGIMWISLLKKYDVKLKLTDFIKYGAAISLPSLAVTLFVLSLII